MLELEVHATSSAPPAVIWPILVDSMRWPEWTALPIPTIERRGAPDPHGLGAVRRFAWGPFGAREEVVDWDPLRRYGYAVIGGMPIRGYVATVTLVPTPDGTLITWQGRFERSTIPGLSRPLRRFTRTMLQGYVRNLADLAGRSTSRER